LGREEDVGEGEEVRNKGNEVLEREREGEGEGERERGRYHGLNELDDNSRRSREPKPLET
jgi:hypothetical protein